MNEQALLMWFMAHPFTRNLCIAVVSGVMPMIVVDFQRLREHQSTEPDATFRLVIALKRYVIGAVVGGGPFLGAEILHILGSS